MCFNGAANGNPLNNFAPYAITKLKIAKREIREIFDFSVLRRYVCIIKTTKAKALVVLMVRQMGLEPIRR